MLEKIEYLPACGAFNSPARRSFGHLKETIERLRPPIRQGIPLFPGFRRHLPYEAREEGDLLVLRGISCSFDRSDLIGLEIRAGDILGLRRSGTHRAAPTGAHEERTYDAWS